MFNYNNLTDFEKLLFAEKQIKELKDEVKNLKKEKGILNSEIKELKYRLKKENPKENKLHQYKKQLKDLNNLVKKYKRLYNKANEEIIRLKNEKSIKL